METAEKLITDNLEVWSSAVKAKSSAGGGSSKKRELYGIKKLRELILDLAVRGMLVPQDPEDKPAPEAIRAAKLENESNVKSGKKKTQKATQEIPPEDELFQVSNGWSWAPLGALCVVLDKLRKPITKKDRVAGPYPYYGASGVVDYVDDFIFDEPLVLVGEDGAKWNKGDNTAFVVSGKTWVNNHAHVIRPNRTAILDEFVVIALTQQDLNRFITGMTVPKLNQARLASIPLPIPPLAEQHRIVAKVDELMALCDQLEQEQESSLGTHDTLVATLLGALTEATASAEAFAQAWQRIQANFDTLFTTESSIDQLKQTILQLAVMGKLVPQDPDDEAAEQIVENVTLERDQLIKEKKIPKAKKLSAPRDNPFTLPSTWCWTQLGSITHLIEYGTSQKSNDDPSRVPVYRMGDIQGGALYDEKLKFVPADIDDLPRLFLEPGDILFNRTNSAELVGKAAIFKGTPGTHTFASYLIRVRVPDHFLNPEFINLSLLAPYFRETQIEPEIIQQCGQANFNGTKLAHTLFPIPPLAEQHRIVAKVDELMALCDQLKASLATAQATQLNLADSLVEQAIG